MRRSSGGRPCRRCAMRAASVSSSAARVWITTGLPSSAASASWRSKSSLLGCTGRVLAEVVEARLADGDGARVAEQRAQLVDAVRVVLVRVVRVDAEAGVDAVVLAPRARGPRVRRRAGSRRRSRGRRRRPVRARGSPEPARGRGARGCRSRPAELFVDDRLVELLEERRGFAKRLAGWKLARLPATAPRLRSRRSARRASGRPPPRPRGTRAGPRASPRSRAARAAPASCAGGTA